MGHHQPYAGRALRAGRVDLRDAALADGGAEDEAVERLSHVPVLVGVGGPAGDLQRAVDAVDGLSDHAGTLSPSRPLAPACGRACAWRARGPPHPPWPPRRRYGRCPSWRDRRRALPPPRPSARACAPHRLTPPGPP